MSTPAAPSGPVSKALEADLRNRVRQQGVVVWLDMSSDYTGFVDYLQGEREADRLPYAVCAFRGSYLELMLQLETLAGGVEKTPLLVHLPGLNEESVKLSPVLELYRAGVRYRKKLETLVSEAAGALVRREEIDSFLAGDEHTLAGADDWLAALLDGDKGELNTQLRALSLTAVVDDLLAGGYVAGRISDPDDEAVLWRRLDSWTGLHEDWRAASLPAGEHRADDIAFATAGWALCVEYVHDLRREPKSPLLSPTKDLPRKVVVACRELAVHLRERHRAFYQRTADETEALLADEAETARAEDLGDIDTFRFEEERVFDAALAALQDEGWSTAARWATLRLNEASFWLREDPARRSAWELIEDAATLGLRIDEAGTKLGELTDLSAAMDSYLARGAGVDRAHRQLEQRWHTAAGQRLPRFDHLRSCLDQLRAFWRSWADAWARDFSAACARHGFLPESTLQQRMLFDDVVLPMTREPGITAYFVVDALRFEMAEELYQTLKDTPATTVQLKARLAELPSVTEVGMNVLAPVASQGKLRPSLAKGKIQGFASGEFRVSDPKTRKRAMHDRVGGNACPWLTLEEVLRRDSAKLKKNVAQAKLVVVHSMEIDDAGEKGAGPAVFERVIQKLRTAWELLRDAGVKRFVITSDHGFLLLDDSSAPAQSHGRKIDPKRRHVFSTVEVDNPGEVRVPLASLDYEGVEGQVVFPDSTAVFDTGKRSMSFVHGGNSLQERLIPVLTLVHRAASGGNAVRFLIEALAEEGVGDMHALSGKVVMDAQATLSFGAPREVELTLQVVDEPNVQVELCQTRGGARIAGGTMRARVDERFELFFRLTGNTETRVLVEVGSASSVVAVAPARLSDRFAVSATGGLRQAAASKAPPPPEGADWLESLPEGGVRALFAHLLAHGAVTEPEAVTLLGSQRKLRRFAVQFEEHAAKAPFRVRIDVVSGVKRYVREGARP